MKTKLKSLRRFFLKNQLYREAYRVGRLMKNSTADHTRVLVASDSQDETVALTNRPWHSYSESALRKAGLEPIRFIAGTEAQKRGEGKSSKEGNVYEVLYKGNLAVAKVLSAPSSPEPEIWRKIMKASESIPQDLLKHLPKIYDIINTDSFTSIIVMEKLSPVSSHIQNILRTKERRDQASVFQNEAFLAEALKNAFNSAYNLKPNPEDEGKSEVFAMFESESSRIKQNLEGAIIKRVIPPSGISDFIESFLSNYKDMFDIKDEGFSREVADHIQNSFLTHIDTSAKPVPKYYSSKGIDYTIKTLDEQMSLDPGGSSDLEKRINILNNEKSQSVYEGRPESFLYSERYMPETKGLFSLLKELNKQGIEWSDVHANNIMERPGTRDLVLIDVGLFD